MTSRLHTGAMNRNHNGYATLRCRRWSALVQFTQVRMRTGKGRVAAMIILSSQYHSSAPRLHYNDDFFRFTRGRFVCNEPFELSQRYVRFNINELARLAAKAVGSTSCVDIKKYPDGLYNKVMLLTMEDGVQAVAKVPNPNAGRPHFTTASEVATMEFARDFLGVPVPKVVAWSSRAEDTTVGAEYIIMEKVPGIQLEKVWTDMDIKDRFAVAKAIARYQEAWMSVSFKQFGSLYYSQDLDKHTLHSPLNVNKDGVEFTDPRFSVGPSIGREFIDDGRANVEFDSGPWDSVEEWQKEIGYREIACVKSLPRLPKSPITLRGPGTYQPSRDKKLKALQYYLALIKYLLPIDQSIASSCLWHNDLHIENIFVNPENPIEIVGIIDWQSSELGPLFYHARQPYFLDYDGPQFKGLERPTLPVDLAKLDPAAQKKAESLYLSGSLCALYKTLLHTQIPRLYRALDFQEAPGFELLLLARNLLIDGEATYLARVVELAGIWDELPGVLAHGGPSYPFRFSDEEKAEITIDAEGAMRGMDVMRAVREALGQLFPERLIVPAGQYEETMDALRQVKEQVIDEFARDERERRIWREEWPFDD